MITGTSTAVTAQRPLVTRQYVSLTASDVLAALLSFASMAVLARTVPVRVLGEVVFAQAAANAAFLVLDPRLEDALVRFVPLLAREQGAGAGARLFKVALLCDVLIGLVAGALAVGVVVLAGVPLGEAGNSTFIVLALLQASAQASQGTVASAYAVTDGLVSWGAIRIVIALGSTAAAVTALLLGGAGSYLAALAIAAAVSTSIVGWMAQRRVSNVLGTPIRLSPGTLGRFWRFAGVASLASSVFVGTEALPLTVVGAAAGPTTLARFRVGLAPARLATTGFSAVPSVLYPLLSRDAALARMSSVRERVMRSTALTIPIVGVLAVVSWVTLPTLVPLIYGPSFVSSVTAARLLVLAALVRGLTSWSKVLAFAIGRPGMRLVVTTVDAILLVSATWMFAVHGTLEGVAAAHLTIAVLISGLWLKLAMSVETAGAPREQTGGISATKRDR